MKENEHKEKKRHSNKRVARQTALKRHCCVHITFIGLLYTFVAISVLLRSFYLYIHVQNKNFLSFLDRVI